MDFTERRQRILESLVHDYIETARPISSEYLARKHRLGVSPATIRWELLELTDDGFLAQPHTSAGRIPTNAGYRFFVDLEKPEARQTPGTQARSLVQAIAESQDELKSLVRELADLTNVAVFGLNPAHDELHGAGWENFFSQPELASDTKLSSEAGAIIDRIFEDFDDFWKARKEQNVRIGKEHPDLSEHFSAVFGSARNRNGEEVRLTILGPNRLDYKKCEQLMRALEAFTN